MRRNFSPITGYSLKFTRCSLLIVKSLATCCRSCSLRKITRFSLQNSLVTGCKSCSLQKFIRYSSQNSLLAKKSLVTRCEICLLLAATNHLLLNAKNHYHLLKESQILRRKIQFFQYNLSPRAKKFKVVPSQHNKPKSVVSRTFSNATKYKWAKTQQLLALNQRNEYHLTKYPNWLSSCVSGQILN